MTPLSAQSLGRRFCDHLLESDPEHALILEDDLAFSSDFPTVLADALRHCRDWDMRYVSVLPFRAWLELSRVTMRFLRCWRLRFSHAPRHAALAATPTLIALMLAVDEVIDNM